MIKRYGSGILYLNDIILYYYNYNSNIIINNTYIICYIYILYIIYFEKKHVCVEKNYFVLSTLYD